MKRLVTAVGFCALALTAFAQTSVDQQVVVPAARSAHTTNYRMDSDEFRKYTGDYYLSNGQTLVLSRTGARMFAGLTGQQRHEIVATDDGEFVALDGKLSMNIALNRLGYASGQVAYVDESRKTAGLAPELKTISFAAR